MSRLTWLRVVWAATLGFLPLYVAVAVQLRPGLEGALTAAQLDWRTSLYGAVAVAAGFASIVARPALLRLGLAYGAASLIAWYLTEVIAVLGFLAFVHGGSGWAFAVHGAGHAVLMLGLFPTRAGLGPEEPPPFPRPG